MVCYQDVTVVRINDVPLARLYDVSGKSQIKHPKTLLWYVSTTSRSYVLLVGLYYTFKLLCRNLHLVGSSRFLGLISDQIPNFFSTNQEGNKKSSLNYKLAELLLHLKTALYNNDACNTLYIYIYIYIFSVK